MPITVKDLRELIDGLSDETEVRLTEVNRGAWESVYAELEGVKRGSHGEPRIVVAIDDHENDEDDDDDEPDLVGDEGWEQPVTPAG